MDHRCRCGRRHTLPTATLELWSRNTTASFQLCPQCARQAERFVRNLNTGVTMPNEPWPTDPEAEELDDPRAELIDVEELRFEMQREREAWAS
jgi:hypothetical protein